MRVSHRRCCFRPRMSPRWSGWALGQIEFALGSIESALGQIEFALGPIESALGQIEFALGSIEPAVGLIEPSIRKRFSRRGSEGRSLDSLRHPEALLHDQSSWGVR